MAETIRVTVAPGCHIEITPHPAGLPGLGALVLHGGNTADVTPERAAELLRARLILDPATGQPVPFPPSAPVQAARPRWEGPTITMGNGLAQPMIGGVIHGPDWAATAQPISSQDRAPTPPPHDCTGGRVFGDYGGRSSGAEIVQADGRPWPSF